jgi:hypothetical protein
MKLCDSIFITNIIYNLRNCNQLFILIWSCDYLQRHRLVLPFFNVIYGSQQIANRKAGGLNVHKS